MKILNTNNLFVLVYKNSRTSNALGESIFSNKDDIEKEAKNWKIDMNNCTIITLSDFIYEIKENSYAEGRQSMVDNNYL